MHHINRDVIDNLFLAIRKISELFCKKEDEKSDLSILIWPFYKNPSKSLPLFCEPKMKDLVVKAKINSIKSRKKKASSTLLFINLSKFWRKKKDRAWLAQKQRNQIFLSPHLIHGRLQSTIDLLKWAVCGLNCQAQVNVSW